MWCHVTHRVWKTWGAQICLWAGSVCLCVSAIRSRVKRCERIATQASCYKNRLCTLMWMVVGADGRPHGDCAREVPLPPHWWCQTVYSMLQLEASMSPSPPPNWAAASSSSKRAEKLWGAFSSVPDVLNHIHLLPLCLVIFMQPMCLAASAIIQ